VQLGQHLNPPCSVLGWCSTIECGALSLCVQGYLYEMYKYEKNGSRTEIARTSTPPTDPVQADVHVPGGIWFLNVRLTVCLSDAHDWLSSVTCDMCGSWRVCDSGMQPQAAADDRTAC
jgi:hypothetical protein